MVLFGVMALFLAQAVALAKFGEFIQRKWWRGGVHSCPSHSMSVVSFSILSCFGPRRRGRRETVASMASSRDVAA